MRCTVVSRNRCALACRSSPRRCSSTNADNVTSKLHAQNDLALLLSDQSDRNYALGWEVRSPYELL